MPQQQTAPMLTGRILDDQGNVIGVATGRILDDQGNPVSPSTAAEKPKGATGGYGALAKMGDFVIDNLAGVGGAIGGTLGLAGGPLTAAGGAVIGGAAGESVRQLTNRFTGRAPAPTSATEATTGIVGQGALQGGAQALGGVAAPIAGRAAQKLMTSALKPAYRGVESAVKKAEMPRVIKTLLDNGVNVTAGGIQKINRLLSATNTEIKDILATSKGVVYPENVIAATGDVARKAASQVASLGDEAAVASVVDDFATRKAGAPNYPLTPISVQRAQELKQGTYQAIGQRGYGEVKGAAMEAEKALARGLKEGIEEGVTDVSARGRIKGLNATEGALIEAKDAIAKRVAAAANRDVAGLAWVTSNPGMFMAFLLDRSPAVKSMLARGLYQSAAKAARVPEHLIRLAVTTLATSGDEKEPQ